MDSCNYPYVLRAMPVFVVLSVSCRMLWFHVASVFAVVYVHLQLTSACLCFSLSVKPSWIRAITSMCFVLCRSLESYLSTGRCVSHVTSVFAVLYLLLLRLFSACFCLSLSVKPSLIHAITLTCFVLCLSLESFCQLEDVVLLCTSCICFLLSPFVSYFCLSIFQFVSEAFLDLCNYPYMLHTMPVFGAFSVNWRIWWLSCTFCICCLLSSSSTYCHQLTAFIYCSCVFDFPIIVLC